MSITRNQVADLQPGDVVELRMANHPGVVTRGPVRVIASGGAYLGYLLLRFADGSPGHSDDCTLTVLSRAPRPLYVNHPRTEPMTGDVVRDADDSGRPDVWLSSGCTTDGDQLWIGTDAEWCYRPSLPARLRLLVNGETGRTVP